MNERSIGERSIGAVIAYISPHSFQKQFLLLKSPRGDWNFVKGHMENQETDHDTLKREILEETGITSLNIFNYLGKIEYKIMKAEFHVTEGGKILLRYHRRQPGCTLTNILIISGCTTSKPRNC